MVSRVSVENSRMLHLPQLMTHCLHLYHPQPMDYNSLHFGVYRDPIGFDKFVYNIIYPPLRNNTMLSQLVLLPLPLARSHDENPRVAKLFGSGAFF